MKASNYAMSPEGRATSELPDYSRYNADKRFDARQNTSEVLAAAMSGTLRNDGLLYSAATALQRLGRNTETNEEWAGRLSKTFFADLDDKS